VKRDFGQTLLVPPYKGRISPHYNHPLFIQAISNCRKILSDPNSEILLDGRNRVGVATIALGEQSSVQVVIKQFFSRGVIRIKSAIFPSKASRAWRGAAYLLEKKIMTPVPIAYLEKKRRLFLEESFFVAEKVDGAEEIRYIFPQLEHSKLRKLLSSLGQYLSFCHNEGVLHKDLSDGNILVKKDTQGDFKFYLIDTNRIRIKKKIGNMKKVMNLVRLGIPLSHQRFFLESCIGELKFKKYLWFGYKFNKMRYSQWIRIKKLLRLKKIARILRIQ
jgi:serine/threonine protein kinase